ncbi:prolyl oligopeptidase family serine peptidase [Stackebrandtia nassauensis]|uniref:Peptidase S9 prolyl oligopeptidase active site domain protein n=1 Tax=Stackebrandtia nassauensis (strain DSM 44728 / CIP 108903 / NRRL B-16338 / NBRC 102104 / LLR-40K-21) TaxID=446470 RepID=D3PU17_STANL|nr:prolyl oligopeptidase family serine peptidase [Stackebrandtia nassauensis]ADD40963.1 peptidase S9 prolyl oligopeptidase active site domain protein [Stackebrandtia nassauensis DSM 44728]
MIHSDFLRQLARTRRFTLGVPRHVRVSPDGQRVVFVRSASGTDATRSLWSVDVDSGEERLLVDPAKLAGGEDVPEEVRRLQERSRDLAAGVTDYATDAGLRVAAIGLAGRLWTVDLLSGELTALPATGPVIDPRPSPSGEHIAYVASGALRVIGADGGGDRALAIPDDADVSYGLAEYAAAEDMHRLRGFWWSPDGDRLLVAKVDNRRVPIWHLADPGDPLAAPTTIRYPAAGTANAEVTLSVRGLDGSTVDVDWDNEAHEYLIAAHWSRGGAVVSVQSRDHSSLLVRRLDPDTGALTTLRAESDPAWVTPFRGVPAYTDGGELVWGANVDGSYRLLVDGEAVTPDGLQLREVHGVDGDVVLFSASDEPTEIDLWAWSRASGLVQLAPGRSGVATLASPGRHEKAGSGVVYEAAIGGGTVVAHTATWDSGFAVTAWRDDREPVTIASHAEAASLTPRVTLLRAGSAKLRTAVLFPTDHEPGSKPLPVLLDPYGGPAGQRVLATQHGYRVSQWFAELGFAVVVADGRGTPGRGPAWDRTIYLDKAMPVLDDQITALRAAAETHPDLDLSRVAIRGWSYGGFLAALAVLRRPDVFHAAVAGAAPSDARLYGTYYQERYLGHPDEHPGAYADASLLDDAPNLTRPLLLIHGLVDDNVHPAHVFKLSAALQRAGREHTLLALPNTTHIPLDADISVNMFRQEARFLLNALGMDTTVAD